MKIIYLSEYNEGGGAKSSLNLAIAASDYADVWLLGIGFDYPQYQKICFIKTRAQKSLSLQFILTLFHAVRKIKPEILHANGMYTGLLALIVRTFLNRKCKIVMTLRHTSVHMRFGLLSRLFIRLLNRIDMVHYLTQYQMDLYKNFGLNPRHFEILPNIIYTHTIFQSDADALRKEILTETASEHIVVFAGRIVESKQVDMFISVIKTLHDKGKNIAGIILGSGDTAYIEKLKHMCEKLNIAGKIIFTGFITEPEIYIKAADFSLFPTQWDEALPRFIIESFSQRKTLVVSNHPSLTDIVTDSVNGLIAPVHTAEGYAEKCLNLFDNQTLLNELEEGAAHTYQSNYLAEIVTDQYKAIYQSLCNQIHPNYV